MNSNMGKQDNKSCGQRNVFLWNACYVLIWIFLVVGILLWHVAINYLVQPMGELPDNLHTGFYKEFRFDFIAQDGIKVQNSALDAIVQCNPTFLNRGVANITCTEESYLKEKDCNPDHQDFADDFSGELPEGCLKEENTNSHLDKIIDSFDNSLTIIAKIADDKYFGGKGLNDTKNFLADITKEMEKLQDVDQCVAINPIYCSISKNAGQLVSGSKIATEAIDKMMEGKFIKEFEENKEMLNIMHALPYLLLLSMGFHTFYWYKDDLPIPFCGPCLGRFGLLFHLAILLIFTGLITTVLVISLIFAEFQNKVPLEGVFENQEPTLEDVLLHIEGNYPNFWMIVIDPLIEPLKMMYYATWSLWACCIFMWLFNITVTCFRPYKEKKRPSTK